MTWLERLKNHQAPADTATKATKPGSVGSVAPAAGAIRISASPAVPPRLRAVPPANAEDLRPVATRTCTECVHLLRHGTCGEPMDAGLLPSFGIIWPPADHATGCAAFSSKAPTPSRDRPHRLSNEQGDRCHAPCWDDAEIDLFQARHARFIRLGILDEDADDLAERLSLRDRDRDDRQMCLECRELALSGRCSAAARGDMPGVDRQWEPVPFILMRCQSFKPAVSTHRNNQGTEDANHDD